MEGNFWDLGLGVSVIWVIVYDRESRKSVRDYN